MILIPDPSTAIIDPACETPTLSMLCDIQDPLTHDPYSRDPRYIARKAEEYLKSTGIAETSYWGPELEFFVFDDVRFDQNEHEGYYHIDSVEGQWNTGAEEEFGNLGYKPRYKEGYFPVPPHDTLQDIRTEMVLEMEKAGITSRSITTKSPPPARTRSTCASTRSLKMADNVLLYKYIVKNVARRNGKVATFMPKPLFHGQRLRHAHPPVPLDEAASPFSTTPRATRSPARCAAGTSAVSSSTAARSWPSAPRPRTPTSASCRATKRPSTSSSPRATAPPPRASPCTPPSPPPSASSSARPTRRPTPISPSPAMLMAGLDGVQNKIDPGQPLEKNTYELTPREEAPPQDRPRLARRLPARPRTGPRLPARRAASSPRTSSTPGSPTSAKPRSTPSASARTRGSSTSTSTHRP